MNFSIIFHNILRFFFLMALQLLVINNVVFTNLIVPFIFIGFLLMLPTNTGRIPMLLIAFASGLIIDFCSNRMGFHAFSATIVALARILVVDRILTRNEQVVITCPSMYSVSMLYFSMYSLILITLYYLVFYLVEALSFHSFWFTLLSVLLSVVVTFGLVLLYQLLFIKKEKK